MMKMRPFDDDLTRQCHGKNATVRQYDGEN